jgi:hypothetical protein
MIARLPLVAHRATPSMRGLLGTALVVVLAEPGLWILGIAGFLLRGGWILVALSIWTLPSPVAVTTLIGPDAIGTGGLSPGLATIVAASIVIAVVVVVTSAIGAAWLDVVVFEYFVRNPETRELRGGREPRELPAGARRGLVGRAVLLMAGAFLPAVGAVFAAAVAMASATYQDFLLPGELAVPLLVRVAMASAGPLLLVAALVVVGEILASALTRRLLSRRYGLFAGADADARVQSGAATNPDGSRLVPNALRVAALCWTVTLVLVLPGVAAALLGWSAIRGAFLGPDAFRGLDAAVAAGGATILFVALWIAALVLTGVSSAIRAALWSGWWLSETNPAVTNRAAAASGSDVPARSSV